MPRPIARRTVALFALGAVCAASPSAQAMVSCGLCLAAMLWPSAAHGQQSVGRVRITPPGRHAPRPDTGSGVRPPNAARVARGMMDGLVTDTSLAPLADAEITVLRTSVKLRTGPNGRFRVSQMPAGQYLVIVRHIGFHPISEVVDISGGDTLRVSYELTRMPQGMDTVHIVTERRSFRMMEFEERRKFGEGQFLGQDQIDKHNSAAVSDLIRTFRGVSLQQGGGAGPAQEYAVSTRGAGGSATAGALNGCVLKIVVDDVLMPTPFDLSLLPSPHEIAGIEVYTGPATIPVRYASPDAHCGMILIWTKDDGPPS